MVLLDTCAIIWMVQDQPMAATAVAAIRQASTHVRVLVSPVSAWEVGLLAVRVRGAVTFKPTPGQWFERLLVKPGIRLTPLTPGAAIAASCLPGQLHSDPADRLLIATARELDVPLVTRDQRILAYAAQGHVQAIAC
jgi:PIN domain nuclease of toxin-antitoxin system